MPTATKIETRLVAYALLGLSLLSAVFYHGVDIGYLVLAWVSLVLLATSIFWNSVNHDIKLPNNSLVIVAALFWCYLILNIPLGNIPERNNYTVWLISLLPATFFLYQLTNIKLSQWNWLVTGIILLAVVLSLQYIYQIATNTLPFNHAGASLFPNRNTLAALLNLVIFTTSMFFVMPEDNRRPIYQVALGTSLFIMTYAMAMTQSRGGLIAFFSALTLLIFLSYRRVTRRDLTKLIAILLMAIFLTTINLSFLNINLGGGSDLFNNLYTLKEPSNAGSSRFLIWEGAWRMVQDAPLLGHGAGMFSLLYPQYRVPEDISGGLFVHNDYLQVWVEMGLPALILLISLLLATTHTFIKFWRSENNRTTQLEAAGLFCALASVGIHSFFTFNLYILSILILSGILLGRLNQLCITDSTSYVELNFKRYIHPSLIRVLIIIMTFIVLSSLASTWAHQYYYQRAIEEHKQKQFDLANKSFSISSKLQTTYASLTSHASLLIDSMQTWSKADVEKRRALYDKALQYLDEARTLNPLRPTQYNVRAHLYSSYPEFGDSNYSDLAQKAYLTSLNLNSRQYKVRYLLAKILISENKTNKALKILEQGLVEPFFPWDNNAPYLQLTMVLRLKKGDKTGAQELARSVKNRQLVYKRYLEAKKTIK